MVMNKYWTSLAFVVAMLMVAGPPVFGTTVTIGDPNEAGIPDGYDIEKLIFDDSNATNLRITYDMYANVLNHDDSQQVRYLLRLGVAGFDQDPSTVDPQTPAGTKIDFQIDWYGRSTDGGGNPISGAKTSFTLEVLAQDFTTVLYTTVTADPMAGSGTDTLVLDIPWANLVDTSSNWAFPLKTINPPSFAGDARVDNGADWADDRVLDSGDFYVPEPITMAGMLMGVSGLAGYIRRRRKA